MAGRVFDKVKKETETIDGNNNGVIVATLSQK